MKTVLFLFSTGVLLVNVALVTSSPTSNAEDYYDYDNLDPFREIERIGRQTGHNDQETHHSHAKIQELNVQCTKSGLTVSVEFDSAFDGLIYSKGHFSDPKCRYVESHTGKTQYTFDVPAGRCGSSLDDFSRTISNVLIFQMDEAVQEIWDTAKRLSCQYTGGSAPEAESRKQGKMVVFKPLSVGMLDVQHQPFKTDSNAKDALDCWMDIQKGTYPNTEPIGGQIEIGEELSIIIYLKDEERQYDVSVKDCWAFDTEQFDDPKASKVQLTGYDGCPRKTKLIGRWMKTFETGDTGATTIAFTNMTAFKFPDSDNVHLTCNIELCKDICEAGCDSVAPSPPRPLPTSSTISRTSTVKTPISSRPQATSRPTTPRATTARPSSRQSTTQRYKPTPTTGDQCGPNSQDPRCVRPTAPSQVTTRRPICYKGTTDPRCPEYSPDEASEEIEAQPAPVPNQNQPDTEEPNNPKCYPGAIDPRCPPDCSNQGAFKDPRCAQPTRSPPTQRPITTRKPAATSKAPLCYPGAVDPRCPPDCSSQGAFKDPRCAQPTPTEPQCYPGSQDPNCASPTTTQRTQTQRTHPTTTRAPITQRPTTTRAPQTQRPTTTRAPQTQRPATTPKAPLCYPGAVDPRCPPDCSNQGAFKDPRCAPPAPTEPECYPGSPDPSCAPPTRPTTTQRPQTQRTYPTTTRAPQTSRPTTTRNPVTQRPTTTRSPQTQRPVTTPKAPLCYPGAVDPRCPPDCSNQGAFKDPRCQQEPIDEPKCYPGSRDPSCSTPTRPTTTQRPQTQRTYPTTTRTPSTQRSTTTRAPPPQRPTTTRAPQTQRPVNTPKAPLCYPGAVDPRCPPDCSNQGAFKDPRCAPPAPTEPQCYPGSRDPKCATPTRPTTTQRPQTQRTTTRAIQTQRPTTTRAPVTQRPTTARAPQTQRPTATRAPQTPRPANTPKPPLCYPGAVDPRCPPDCSNQGAFKDPRCVEEPVEEPKCYLGSRDPSCSSPTRPTTTHRPQAQRTNPTTRAPVTQRPTTTRAPITQRPTTSRAPQTQRPTTTRTPQTQRPVNTPKAPLCYPGAVDPRCPPDCSNQGPFKDPRCVEEPVEEPKCYQGSRSPSCVTPRPATTQRPQAQRTHATTTRAPVTQRPTTTRAPVTQRPTTTRAPVTQRPTTTRAPQTQKPTTTRAPQTQKPTTTRAPQTQRPTTTRAPQTQRPTTTRAPQTQRPVNTPKAPLCYPGAVDPRCPPDCSNQGVFKDPRCASPTPTEPQCYPGSRDPSCASPTRPTTTQRPQTQRTHPTTTRAPVTQRPTTTRVSQTQRPTTTRAPQTQRPANTPEAPLCYPGAVDPRCPPDCSNQGAFKDPRCAPAPTEPQCYPGSRDPSCATPTTTHRPQTQRTTTTRAPVTQRPTTARAPQTQRPTTTRAPQTQRPGTTVKALLCYPGAVDPRCPPDCSTQGAFKDPRCPQETITEPQCYPGSRNPSCASPTTTQRPQTQRTTTRAPVTQRPTTTRAPQTQKPTTTRAPQTQRPANTPKAPLCYPGAVDPRCPPDCSNQGAFKDPRCAPPTPTEPQCYPGSKDPSCASPTRPTTTRAPQTQRTYPTTTRTPVTQRPTTTRAPQTQKTTIRALLCYPGAVDPRCPPDCSNQGVFKDPRCSQPTPTEPQCYPGSRDPSCATPTRPTTTHRPQTQRTYPTTTRAPATQRPTTTRAPPTQRPITTRKPAATSKAPLCYPGAVDPRCPPDCSNQGAFKDPRCVEEPAEEPKCYPGSQDPSCDSPTRPTTTHRPQTQRTYPTTTRVPTTQRPTTTRAPQTQRPVNTPKAPLCYPGAVDPRCPPDCSNQGAFRDPRCPASTVAPIETTRRPICFPGSTDSRCSQPEDVPEEEDSPVESEPPSPPPKKPLCYPGQIDPRCPPICPSTDIRCRGQ